MHKYTSNEVQKDSDWNGVDGVYLYHKISLLALRLIANLDSDKVDRIRAEQDDLDTRPVI